MKPKGRNVRSWEVKTGPQTDEDWVQAEANRTLDRNAIACGAVQHPETGLWQVWVSLYGADLTQWVAYEDERRAALWADRIGQAFRNGRLNSQEQVVAMIDAAMADGGKKPQELPDRMVLEVLMHVAGVAVMELEPEPTPEKEDEEYKIIERAVERMQQTAPIQCSIKALDAWAIVAMIQLASRHDVTPWVRQSTRQFCFFLSEQLDPETRELLNRGWDPSYDQPRTRQ